MKNLSLRAKIVLSFSLVCVGLLAVSVNAYIALNKVVDRYENLAQVSVPALGHLSGLRARARQVQVESVKLVLYKDDAEMSAKTMKSLDAGLKRYHEITTEYQAGHYPADEKPYFEKVVQDWAPVEEGMNQIKDLFKSHDPSAQAKLREVLVAFEDRVKAHAESIKALDDYHVDLGERWAAESRASAKSNLFAICTVSGLTLFVALLISYLLSKSISSTLLQISSHLLESSDLVTESTKVVNQASSQVAEGTVSQAEAVQETVASISEITAMTAKTVENSNVTLANVEKTVAATQTSEESLLEMVEAIGRINDSNKAINDQVDKGNNELQKIVALIGEIEQKTKVINDIVFQTKLLSFNASIESARAGEHGKGFSVVAEEVSVLANMSGVAAQEISSMLNQATERTRAIVQGNRESIERLLKEGNSNVQRGKEVVEQCRESLGEIASSVGVMRSMIEDTSKASAEQAVGISEINKAMGSIDLTTSGTATAANESSRAAAQLMEEVENTRAAVATLLKVIHGQNSGAAEVEHRTAA